MNDSKSDTVRPEELVKRETKVVNFLRAVLILVLIVVGAVLSYGSYRSEKKWEEDTYQREFKAISSRITSDFKNAVTRAMWNGYVIGAAISGSSDLMSSLPNLTIPNFDQLVAGAVQSSRIPGVYWSPILYNDEERKRWESYAQEQINLTTSKPAFQCFACGSQNLTVGSLTKEVQFPMRTYSCGDIEYSGFTGLITEKYCSFIVSLTKAQCDCRPRVPGDLFYGPYEPAKPRSNHIYTTDNRLSDGNITMPVEGDGPFSPIWQAYPAGMWASMAMYDMLADKNLGPALHAMVRTQSTVISYFNEGVSAMFAPVFENPQDVGTRRIIGSIGFPISWESFLEDAVPVQSKGIDLVIENSCGQKRTFQSTGDNIIYSGLGDLHEPEFSLMVTQTSFEDFFTSQSTASPYRNGKDTKLNCAYRLRVYSSEKFRSNYISRKPQLYATGVSLIFVFTGLVFITYDCYVARRQRKVMNAVLQRDEIVSSLFPAAVRERLFRARQATSLSSPQLSLIRSRTSKIVSGFLQVHRKEATLPHIRTSQAGTLVAPRSDPIADYFPNVTIVFADISGFTAWSSEREPTQVFQLLETVYQAFDKFANKYGVFKIETIGDCYVAVAGIPVFQPDHAVRAVQFAYECILHMHQLTHELESTLGPSTSALSIRVGAHSGPVIAGVLRGEKCRFQLFGDTVNTTARMQTTGENSRIQISEATANLLKEADKLHWIQRRDVPVSLKGKGSVQTFWVDPHTPDIECDQSQNSAVMSTSCASKNWGDAQLSSRFVFIASSEDKTRRLVEWNTDLLWRLIKKLVAARKQSRRGRQAKETCKDSHTPVNNGTPFDEVTDIIAMHEFDEKNIDDIDPESVELSDAIRQQLQDYVATIASMYHDNPFHNFEHASHVALSASKVVMRIIRPDVEHQYEALASKKGRLAFKRKIHESTFGISSDVMMQFAVVFSAVIHDVDHVGVSNAQLVKEGQDTALRYGNKCVAEQNSVDIAWDLLMKPQYKDLFQLICHTPKEQQRFRQLLVNAVIATDIADKELQLKRKNRWDKAFHCGSVSTESEITDAKVDMDRKATIVFEYIIQASDVAHTMQHWKVYTQWNERLFEERYKAYLCGREEQDPSVGWYKGEIWFFDNYIIPLAKKLETCGVFGVSSDEYLSYALENRHDWELKGEEMVKEMVKKFGGGAPLDEPSLQGRSEKEPFQVLLGTLRFSPQHLRRHSTQ